MVTLFSNPMHLETVGCIAKCSKYTGAILAPPWNCIIYCCNLQPPQGLTMESIFLSTSIIATVLSFVQLCWYLIQNKKDHTLNKDKNKKKAYLTITTAFNDKISIENLTDTSLISSP